MSLYRIKSISVITAAAALVLLADAQAQTSPPEPAPAAAPPTMTGALYQGLPGVWINQGKHLWFCQWQGNAAPRSERISCYGTDLPATPSR